MRRSLAYLLAMTVAAGLCVLTARPARAADGAALYSADCAKCHGADGHADTAVGRAMKVPPLAVPKWAAADATDAFLAAFHENPKHKSVATKVSDDDLRAINAFVQTLASAE